MLFNTLKLLILHEYVSIAVVDTYKMCSEINAIVSN